MRRLFIITLLTATVAASATAAPGPDVVERLHYKWSLRGALAWIARAAFPTSGTGTLETISGAEVSSKLMVGEPKSRARIFYESRMTSNGEKTLTSSDGYVWRDHDRQQFVTFDYLRRLARVEKTTEDGHERKVRKLNSDTPKDVLTAIYYIRQNMASFHGAQKTEIYSGGKPYSFIITPQPATMLDVSRKSMRVRPFLIEPVEKDRGGRVRVWISDDGRNLPVQIEIQRDHATLVLSATNV